MKQHIKINEIHSGPRGWKSKLMEIHGEQKVREYWKEHGNRKTARHFGVPVSTIDHCKVLYRWKRPLENVPQVLKGVARGNIHPKKYPHLEFKVPNSSSFSPVKDEIQRHAYYLMKKGTFIGWCIINDGYTYCHEIYMWLRGDPKMDWVESYEDQIQAMKEDKSGYFEPRHFDKVETVYKYYSERKPGFRFED